MITRYSDPTIGPRQENRSRSGIEVRLRRSDRLVCLELSVRGDAALSTVCSIFSQVLKLIPRAEFDSAVPQA